MPYDVHNEIETEEFVYGSGDLFLDESALQWHKMSDDSDSDFEDLLLGGCGLFLRGGVVWRWCIQFSGCGHD